MLHKSIDTICQKIFNKLTIYVWKPCCKQETGLLGSFFSSLLNKQWLSLICHMLFLNYNWFICYYDLVCHFLWLETILADWWRSVFIRWSCIILECGFNPRSASISFWSLMAHFYDSFSEKIRFSVVSSVARIYCDVDMVHQQPRLELYPMICEHCCVVWDSKYTPNMFFFINCILHITNKLFFKLLFSVCS